MEVVKRVAAVVVALLLLISSVVGWLVGENPDPQMAGEMLVSFVGGAVGTLVAWFVRRRDGQRLRTKPIIYASIGGACALWFVLALAQGGGGVVVALGTGLGGGLTAGVLYALIWYGIRGPVPEEQEEAPA